MCEASKEKKFTAGEFPCENKFQPKGFLPVTEASLLEASQESESGVQSKPTSQLVSTQNVAPA